MSPLSPNQDLAYPYCLNRSEQTSDLEWDRFLESCSNGHFEQSSMWARMKEAQGWKFCRVAFRNEEAITGGFQLLYRQTRLGRVGYLNKGPVFADNESNFINQVIALMKRAGKRLGLRAIIMQLPVSNELIHSKLDEQGFRCNHRLGIIRATWVIDVSARINDVEAQMSRTTRKHIKQAQRHGIIIRQGGQEDIALFFSQMLETCRRQRSHPNPASESDFLTLWQAAKHSGGCRLTIAEHQGKPISALFSIPFGRVVHIWKKGSVSEALHLHSMDLLYLDALTWANANGLKYCDFGSLNPKLATILLAGGQMTEEHRKSRDCYNLGFGGIPVLLPSPRLFFFNPFLQGIWRIFAPWFSKT